MFETRFSRLLAVLLCLLFLLTAPGSAATASRSPGYPLAGPAPGLASGQPASPVAAGLDESFGQMPLYLVENRGQLDDRVAYYVLGGPTQVYFAADGVTFGLMEPDEARGEALRGEALPGEDMVPMGDDSVSGEPASNPTGTLRSASPLHARARGAADAAPRQRWAVKLDFVGANSDARPFGEDQTQAIVSYFKGAPDQWHAGLATYARVVYRDLWPGIDLAYYGQAGRLKYDFLVHPGADPAQIRLRYRGAESVSLNAARQMVVSTPLGGLVDDAPRAWQEIDGQRAPVFVDFDLADSGPASSFEFSASGIQLLPDPVPGSGTGAASSFGFSLGAFDRSQPLVIDPAMLVYCGYIGGLYNDSGSGIAVDGAGNAYVTGTTTSTQDSFPETVGPELTHSGKADAFVAKVNASGAALIYAGYIGGSEYDYGYGIDVDGAGNAYVTGQTASDEDTFPKTVGPGLIFNGQWDAFVAKVSASGTALVYAGYIGGLAGDVGSGIAVDREGNAYVTGNTDSTKAQGFPVTVGPYLTHKGGNDAFVAKVSASSAVLVYCGYIGGSGEDYGRGIAVDRDGNAYVTGDTASTEAQGFPTKVGPYLTHKGGTCGSPPYTYPCHDAFVAKVDASGAALVYAGYIGGKSDDYGRGIAVDGAGGAYVTGDTDSTEAQDSFPVKVGPGLTYNGGTCGSPPYPYPCHDAFVAKVDASGAALVYAGYVGGSGGDYGNGIDVDDTGNAYVTGWTSSDQDTFPVTGGPYLTYNGGPYDAFVGKVSASGAALVYAGYIGGSGDDVGSGIAVDRAGKAYVTGWTSSTRAQGFPVTVGPYLTYNGGYYDAFVAKVFEASSAAYLPLVMRGN